MKVAVFGKPGGGKSTLSGRIAQVAELPLHGLDLIQFASGGRRIADDAFLRRHAELIAGDRWVIDGLGPLSSFEERLRQADVLVYVDRPTITHYWWVTKRLLQSPFRHPLGWPPGSPMVRSTLSSYRFLWLSSRFWTPAFRERILLMRPDKRVYIVAREPDAETMLAELKALASGPTS